MKKTKNKKVVAIIQARMSSTRLPGKILMELLPGKTALECMLERIKRSKRIDKVVVAAADAPADQKLHKFLKRINQPYFVGSEYDALDRYYQTAKKFCGPDDVIVRLTSDCPVIDPYVSDAVIDYYFKTGADFASNSLEPATFPDGMDTEVFSFRNLERATKEAILPSDKEHVTFYFWKNPDLFKIAYYKNSENLSQYRLTLDYKEDFEVLREIYRHFSPDLFFPLSSIIAFLKAHPELRDLQKNIVPGAGWQKALEKDKVFLKSRIKNKKI
jgi:spore coat polysaccharide biosynthesis protein SpsF